MSDYIYPAGTLLVLETGEYSDFGTEGIYVTLCDLDLQAEIEAWAPIALEVHTKRYLNNEWPGMIDHTSFTGWLCAEQKVAAAKCSSCHLGSYGRIEVGRVDLSLHDLDDQAEDAARDRRLATPEPSE